ncbi:MAG: SDR family oxidoreductase [Parasphingorhabdus sp.]|nr:SDR family oxidoreductase [Parasphingorhabdus sp.]
MSTHRTAFITGGTSGIGRATALRLASAGWRVAAVGRRDMANAGETPNILPLCADVTDESALANALARTEAELGKIDLLFNNAGGENIGEGIEEQDAQGFRDLIELNVIAVYNGLRLGPAHMKDGGSIVNTASVAAIIHLPGYAQYSATKAAVVSLSKSAALELAARRIRVNAIAPGSIWSEMLEPGNPEVALVEIACPLGRVGEADEVAKLVEFLANDGSAYITGQLLPIDGGVTAGYSQAMIEKLLS